MKFSFSSEQEEFRTSLRRFLAERSPTKEVRRLMETDAGFEPAAWRKLNTELGLTAVRIPEAYGGQGFGFGELGIVLEEMGRAVLCAPFFSTAVLATGAILNAGTENEKQALLPGIAAGDTIATLAWVEDAGRPVLYRRRTAINTSRAVASTCSHVTAGRTAAHADI